MEMHAFFVRSQKTEARFRSMESGDEEDGLDLHTVFLGDTML
jgi:hypothetical protein